jgi:hypothetical protein
VDLEEDLVEEQDQEVMEAEGFLLEEILLIQDILCFSLVVQEEVLQTVVKAEEVEMLHMEAAEAVVAPVTLS